jgi:hypothetical protein
MRARAIEQLALCGGLGASLVCLRAVPASAQDFTYMPPGELIAGSGSGTPDATVYAPGMRFPIEQAPAFANSQVWGHGGGQGPGGGQCDVENFSYPWWDNYCETRSWDMPLCPSGEGHQGQDIRASTCDKDVHWAVAAVDGTITQIGSYSVYLTADDGTRFDYLHMSNVQVGVGQEVTSGQHLGLVSNEFGGTPTTVHLHFNIRQLVEGVGTVYVPTYMSLVQSYSALLGPVAPPVEGYLDEVSCESIRGWAASMDALDQAVEAKLYFDEGPVGHPVLADLEREDLCDAIGSCDHGFEIFLPLSLLDGDDHSLTAHGSSPLAGSEPVLEGSPKDFSCALELGIGLRRPVSEQAQINWRFSSFWDIADVDQLDGGDAALADRPLGTALDDFARIVTTEAIDADGSEPGDLWLVDAGYRRPIDALAARGWGFSADLAESWTAAELEELPLGAPVPVRPMVLRDASGALFLIDDPDPASHPPPGGSGGTSAGGASDGEIDGGCGCTVPGSTPRDPWTLAWSALGALALASRLRKRRAER